MFGVLENKILTANGHSVKVLDLEQGEVLDIFHYESKIQSFHLANSSSRGCYLGLENGMIFKISKKYHNNKVAQTGDRKIGRLEAILQNSSKSELESVPICHCLGSGGVITMTSSTTLLAAILSPNKILLLSLDPLLSPSSASTSSLSYKFYSSSSTSPLTSLCFLSQSLPHEHHLIERLHIDLSFGLDNFLLIGTHSGHLEYLRLVLDEFDKKSSEDLVIVSPTDISTPLSLTPISSCAPSPIISIFIDAPLTAISSSSSSPPPPPLLPTPTPTPVSIPQVSSNYRLPLLCLLTSDGSLLIYRSFDSKRSYLNKHLRLTLVGSCLWKYPCLPSDLLTLSSELITSWNGLLLSLHSGSLFAYSIVFDPLLQSYSISPPILLTPPSSQFLTSFTITPSSSSSSQFLSLEYDSHSISALPLQPLLDRSSYSPSLSSLPLTQHESHHRIQHKLTHALSASLLHYSRDHSQHHPLTFRHHLSSHQPHDPQPHAIRGLLNEISNSMAIENELRSLIEDLDLELIQFLSVIQLLQTLPRSHSPSGIVIPGLDVRLTFDEYSQHDTTYLFGSVSGHENQNTSNLFLGVLTLRTTSELVMKSLQGRSIQLSWSEEAKGGGGEVLPPVTQSWSHQISFQSQSTTRDDFLFSLLLPLPISHLSPHILAVDILLSSSSSLHQTTTSIFHSLALNPHQQMKITTPAPSASLPQIYGMSDYYSYQQGFEPNPSIGALHCDHPPPLDSSKGDGLIFLALDPIRCDLITMLKAIQGREHLFCPSTDHSPLLAVISSSQIQTQLTSPSLHTSEDCPTEMNQQLLHSLILNEIRQDQIRSSSLPHSDRLSVTSSHSITLPLAVVDSFVPELEEIVKGVESQTRRNDHLLLSEDDNHRDPFTQRRGGMRRSTLEYSSKILSSSSAAEPEQASRPFLRLTHRSNSRLLLCLVHAEIRRCLLWKKRGRECHRVQVVEEEKGYVRYEKDIYSLPRDLQQVCAPFVLHILLDLSFSGAYALSLSLSRSEKV
jgi:hypothetical protein